MSSFPVDTLISNKVTLNNQDLLSSGPGLLSVGGIEISGGGAGSGKVLQVVNAIITGQGSITINKDAAPVATNPSITKSITPIANNSRFLVKVRWFGETQHPTNVVAHIYRGTSRVNEGGNTTANFGLSMAAPTLMTDFDSTPDILTLETFDTTAGTVAGTPITYTLKFSVTEENVQLWTNRVAVTDDGWGTSQRETGVSEIIIMEVGI
jgi:hypothetical protein